jgi:integrase/recombinase XerD
MAIYSIIPQLRLSRPNDDYGTITFRAFFNRKPVASKSTGHRVLREHWNHYNRRVEYNAPNAQLLNTVIEKEMQEVQARILKKEIMGAVIHKEHVKAALLGHNNSTDFIIYCQERIESDYPNAGTRLSYYSECNKLTGFKPVISFADIDERFLHRYKNYLSATLGNNSNTVWRSLKFIRTMIRKAIRQGGIITANPFNDFEIGKCGQSDRKPISVENYRSIEALITEPYTDERIRAIAVRFLLMVNTGMRYSDAMNFDADVHLQNGRFIMQYKKFNEKVNYAAYDKLLNMITLAKRYPLQISNQDFNRNLKVIGLMCKIDVPLTTHVARHTTGYFLAEMDVPKEKAQKILGHRDPRSTDVYYHITEDQVDREVQKLNRI